MLIQIPRALESYPSATNQSLASELAMRVQVEPFNAVATAVFFLAILHPFGAARVTELAHRLQHRHDERARAEGYLATLVPDLDDAAKLAVVPGAVVGGGLRVIANAPNPAGQALLARFFAGGILPIGLLAGALLPTLIAAAISRLL